MTAPPVVASINAGQLQVFYKVVSRRNGPLVRSKMEHRDAGTYFGRLTIIRLLIFKVTIDIR